MKKAIGYVNAAHVSKSSKPHNITGYWTKIFDMSITVTIHKIRSNLFLFNISFEHRLLLFEHAFWLIGLLMINSLSILSWEIRQVRLCAQHYVEPLKILSNKPFHLMLMIDEFFIKNCISIFNNNKCLFSRNIIILILNQSLDMFIK